MDLKKVKTALVVFKPSFTSARYGDCSKEYAFKTDVEDLKEGDVVVCDCSSGYSLGVVTSVIEGVSKVATKWIIQKVDVEAHVAKLEAEKKLIQLKRKMIKRASELTVMSQFEILAEKDEQMAELLSEFKLISGGSVQIPTE